MKQHILFRLDASIRTEGSVTRQVADTAQAVWQRTHPNSTIIQRELGTDPLPADVWPHAAMALFVPPEEHNEDHRRARQLAAGLVDELVTADAFLFAVPLYNFGPSQHFKNWVDLILTDPRMALSGDRPLTGRPATLVTARGGGYGPGTPREGWDHSTPWLVRILKEVFGLDLRLSEAELTLADTNPAMESLRGLAKESLQAAHESAEHHGGFLAERVAVHA